MANKLFGTLGKGLSAAGKVVSIFDTVAMVDKVSKNTAPIVEKAIDRHYDYQKELISLPDLIHLPMDEAKAHLESLGFLVSPILAKPNQLNKHSRAGEVISQVPRSGKFKAGHLIKLYYANDDLVAQSQTGQIDLPNLIGLPLDEAIFLLEQKGFLVTSLPAKPKKDYATQVSGIVVDSDPKPNLITKSAKKGSLIRLSYLTEDALTASQDLLAQHLAKQEEMKKTVDETVNKAQKNADQLLGGIKGIFTKTKTSDPDSTMKK